MPNWIQNYIQLVGPKAETRRFRTAVGVDGCSKGCAGGTLCLHKLVALALPDYDPPEGARLAYSLVDEYPFDEEENAYNVFSDWKPIGRLLCLASMAFKELTIDYRFCDLRGGCGHEWNYYFMKIKNGRVSEARSDHYVAKDNDQVFESSQTYADGMTVFEEFGDWCMYEYQPPILSKALEEVAAHPNRVVEAISCSEPIDCCL